MWVKVRGTVFNHRMFWCSGVYGTTLPRTYQGKTLNVEFRCHRITIYITYLIIFAVESCSTDDPLSHVYMQQTSFNTLEYIASCRTGYELVQKESIFTCHKQQWRPSAPRCAQVVRSSTQSDTRRLYTSTSSAGKTHPFFFFFQ